MLLTSAPGVRARLLAPPPPSCERWQPEQRRQHDGGAEQNRGRAAPPPAPPAPLLPSRYLPAASSSSSDPRRVRRVPRRLPHHPADPLTAPPPPRPFALQARPNARFRVRSRPALAPRAPLQWGEEEGMGGNGCERAGEKTAAEAEGTTAEAQRQRVSARVLPRVKSGSGSRSYRPCGKRYQ